MTRSPDGPLRRAGIAALLALTFGLAGTAAGLHERESAGTLAAAATPVPVTSAPVAPAPAAGPGAVTETPGAGICTAGFVFTGGGRVLLAQAAHCAGTGPDTETDGCTSSTLRPGVPVLVRGGGGPVTGRLRYSSWTAMQDGRERDPDICAYNDFALVELPGAGSSLPLLGGPAGIRTTPPRPGSTVHGLADPDGPDGGRPPVHRAGTTGPDEGGGWLHTVRSPVPGTPGESGGPLVDDRGMALGVLSGMRAGGDRSLEYTDLARAVAYARTHGGPPDLALIPGTVPFAVPPG